MFANQYLQKNQSFLKILTEPPHNDLQISIVIPCYDEPQLIRTLESLLHCDMPHCAIEVIVVINSSAKASEKVILQNQKTIEEAELWIRNNSTEKLKFLIIEEPQMPVKYAGVGLARKIGMDAAVYRYNLLNKPDGLIVGFDADSLVDSNYFIELEKYFLSNPCMNACSIYFEHPVSGSEFSDHIYQGIVQYELHLRYFNQALKFTGFPYSFHTIGSSFAVKAEIYTKQGGMNKKQAGEDFYFLHKIIPLGNYVELNTTRVIPSPRSSDRVPFGTGAAIQKWIVNKNLQYLTYNFKAFLDIKKLIDICDSFFISDKNICEKIIKDLPVPLTDFLIKNDFFDALTGINNNSPNLNTFRKRYFAWFDAFRIIKFLNFSHENFYERMPITVEAVKLLSKIEKPVDNAADDLFLLDYFRKFERGIS